MQNIPVGLSILLDGGHYWASTLNVPLQDSVENIRQLYNNILEGQPRPDYMHGRRLSMEAEYYRLQLEVLPTSNVPTYDLTRITHHILSAEVLVQLGGNPSAVICSKGIVRSLSGAPFSCRFIASLRCARP